MTHRPLILAILDGYGEHAPSPHNAVTLARTPHLTALKNAYPHGLIDASELHVGLPEGQMGNSEVGHMNIGSGRVVMQELPRIDHAIKTGELAANATLLQFVAALKASGGVCHLLGLLSDGGVHAHLRHMSALVALLGEHGVGVHVHAILDGRDTPPQSALGFVQAFAKATPGASIATVSGRYYAMDRDTRWSRVEKAWQAIAQAEGPRFPDIEAAIQASYDAGVTDEFLLPATLGDYAGMQDGDGVLMANFRSDRAREIMQALIEPAFAGFPRARAPHLAIALTMTEYSAALAPYVSVLFQPEKLQDILAEVISQNGFRQLHIAETEKYAHVTFFFNGGREAPFAGEDRILVPSPSVATYDLQPAMSAPEVTQKLVAAIDGGRYDFIVVNYANMDMVGHTGNIPAAIQAVEAVDDAIGALARAVEAQGGALIVTADHGNIEQMHDATTGQPHTAHTVNQVPLILAVPALKQHPLPLKPGKLADIAPTVLALLGLPQPVAMTGRSLLP